LGTLMCLQGCDLAPPYHPPTVAVPTAFKEDANGPWRLAKPADDTLRGPWWSQFGDPELNRLEGMIDTSNPGLAAAVARYDEARALAAEANAGLLPSLNFNGSYNKNRQSEHKPLRSSTQPNYFNTEQVGLSAGYELDFWGKLRNTATSGEASAQASAADLATARLGLHTELLLDFMTLRSLDQRAKVLSDTVANYGRALDLTQSRFEGHIASGIDVARAQTQLDTAKAAVSDTAARRAQIEHAIAALVGQPASSFSLPASTTDMAMPVIPAGLPSTLLQRRPDVAAAERRVFAANANIGVARAAFYPSFTITGNAGLQSTRMDQLLMLPSSVWTIGPNVNLPLFEGGRLNAEEARTYARQREVGADYRQTVLTAFREVEDNLSTIHWLGIEAKDETSAEDAAQRTVDMATNLYQAGADSYLDVVTAQTALLEVELTVIDIKTRRLQADGSLVKALGGGWQPGDLPQGDALTALPPLKTDS
jgi:NodT family efflux transporter outer membrane factor (OMF) lipoprotein